MSTPIVKFVLTPNHHLLGFNECEPEEKVRWFDPTNRYFAADSNGIIHRIPLGGVPECDSRVRVGPVFRGTQFEKLTHAEFCPKCFDKERMSQTMAITETVFDVLHSAAA
jgi:hypothetical protein